MLARHNVIPPMNDEEPNPVGKRTRPKRSDSFEAEVQSRFGPVVGRWGLEGPVVDGVLLPTVKYHTDRLAYTWMLDEDDKALTVDVDLVVAGGSLSIDARKPGTASNSRSTPMCSGWSGCTAISVGPAPSAFSKALAPGSSPLTRTDRPRQRGCADGTGRCPTRIVLAYSRTYPTRSPCRCRMRPSCGNPDQIGQRRTR